MDDDENYSKLDEIMEQKFKYGLDLDEEPTDDLDDVNGETFGEVDVGRFRLVLTFVRSRL
jgi:hypothetical protein